MNILDLEKQLQAAQDRLQKVLRTLKSRSGSAKDAMQASDDVAAAQRVLAAANCKHIKFLDNEGLNLSTECGDRAVWAGGSQQEYLSKDGGKMWQKK